jgi:hypothetical protein
MFRNIKTVPLPVELEPFDIDSPLFISRTGATFEIQLTETEIQKLLHEKPSLRLIQGNLRELCSKTQELNGLHDKIFKQALMTWLHIHSRTADDWLEDISDYVQYGCVSFGVPSQGGKEEYLSCLMELISKGNTIFPMIIESQQSEKLVIRRPDHYLPDIQLLEVKQAIMIAERGPWFQTSEKRVKEVMSLFDEYYNSVPIELPVFKEIRQEWESQRDLLQAAVILVGGYSASRTNRYSKRQQRAELQLNQAVNVLNFFTDHLMEKFNVQNLHEHGKLNAIDELKFELLQEISKKKQKLLKKLTGSHMHLQFEEAWCQYLEVQKDQLELLSDFYTSPKDGDENDACSQSQKVKIEQEADSEVEKTRCTITERLERFERSFMHLKDFRQAVHQLTSYMLGEATDFLKPYRMKGNVKTLLAYELGQLHRDFGKGKFSFDCQKFYISLFDCFDEADAVGPFYYDTLMYRRMSKKTTYKKFI